MGINTLAVKEGGLLFIVTTVAHLISWGDAKQLFPQQLVNDCCNKEALLSAEGDNSVVCISYNHSLFKSDIPWNCMRQLTI